MDADVSVASLSELRRLERLHFDAWPALEVLRIGGLRLRRSGGGSRRANSVSSAWCEPDEAVDFDRAFAMIEAEYAKVGAPALVQSFGAGPLPGLVGELQRRGYRAVDGTITMVKRIAPTATDGPALTGSETLSAEWLHVYLGAITENRRLVNERILRSMTTKRRFFTHRHRGVAISTALGIVDGDQAVIECVATRADARRLGGAAAVLADLESWAASEGVRLIGLQVVADNEPGLGLYARLGFTPVDHNRYWSKG